MYFDVEQSDVVNSRYLSRRIEVWRRRKTPQGAIFTTRERVDLTALNVIKRDKSEESYEPAKLLLSLARAVDHRPRAAHDAWHLMQTIESKIIETLPDDHLHTERIAEVALEVLLRFDTTAELKYRSYLI